MGEGLRFGASYNEYLFNVQLTVESHFVTGLGAGLKGQWSAFR